MNGKASEPLITLVVQSGSRHSKIALKDAEPKLIRNVGPDMVGIVVTPTEGEMKEVIYYRTPYGDKTSEYNNLRREQQRFLGEKVAKMTVEELIEKLSVGSKATLLTLVEDALFGKERFKPSAVKYVACDGTSFTDGSACKEYELQRAKEVINSNVTVRELFNKVANKNSHAQEFLTTLCMEYTP